MVVGCPFKCSSGTANTFRQLKQHLIEECPNELLNCKGCGFEIYKHYAVGTPTNSKGHNCMRDNPTSPLLLRNMRNIVRKVSSRELSQLEQELVLYRGPIPFSCIPNIEEPEDFFNVEQKMNMSDELVEYCKQFLVRALRSKGYTKDAASSVIDDLEQLEPTKHWRVMIMTKQQLNALAGRASCNGHYLKMTYRKGGIDFSVQIQQVV